MNFINFCFVTDIFRLRASCTSLPFSTQNHNLLVSACVATSPSQWLDLGAILWLSLLPLYDLSLRVIMARWGSMSVSAWHNDTSILCSFLAHLAFFWLSLNSEVMWFQKLYRKIRELLCNVRKKYHIVMTLSYFLTCFTCMYLHQNLFTVLLPISRRTCFATLC